MLTGIQVVFLGGDARQLEVIQKISELDATVLLIGFDNLEQLYSGVSKSELTADLFNNIDVLILPAVGTDDQGFVETMFSSQHLQLLDEHIDSLPKHAKVYTGLAKNYLRELCRKHQIELVELFERDDVAIYNSIPTTEGAIMMAIQNTDITIHGSVCMVLGSVEPGLPWLVHCRDWERCQGRSEA